MLLQITAALVKEIHAHADTIIGGIIACIAGVLGAVVTFALSLWQQRGKVTATPLEMYWKYQGDEKIGAAVHALKPEQAKQINFDFELRILNTFPIDQSIGLLSVGFFDKNPKGRKKHKPLLTDSLLHVGESWNEMARTDIRLPAHGFKRVYLTGAGVTEETNPDARAAILKSVRGVQIRFIVSPKRILTVWHELSEKERGGKAIPENKPNANVPPRAAIPQLFRHPSSGDTNIFRLEMTLRGRDP